MLDPKQMRKILVINLAFIGDVLLASPVTRALKENYPDAVIDTLVIPLTTAVAERNPYVRTVLAYDKRGKHRKIGELWQLIKSLRAEKYDLAVSMNFSLRSSLMAWATGARYRLGYDTQGGGVFLTHKASSDRSTNCHETENHLAILKPLGIITNDTSLALSILSADAASMDSKVKLKQGKQPVVVICPVGSYPQKSLTIESYAEIIRRLSPHSRGIMIGSDKEKEQLKRINDAAGKRAEVLAGVLSLGELAALIKEAKLMITVDTGPMHMAQAFCTPVIAVFGPTDPRIWGPRNCQDVVFYTREDCSPCWGRTACAEYKCMRNISAHDVSEAALVRIDQAQPRGDNDAKAGSPNTDFE